MPTRRTILTAAACGLPALAGYSAEKRPPLRYLQIGTGHAHANKISSYAESADWEVLGIVEEDPELLRKAKKHPVFQQFPIFTLAEALNRPGIDVIGVETRIDDLLAYARIAVDQGYHVHLDKPAGVDIDAYRTLLADADRKNLVVQMGYMYRFNPAVRLLQEMLRAGWLGHIFETHAVMSKQMSSEERSEVAKFPGGTMFELGCHLIDLTIGILGKPDQVHPYVRHVGKSGSDNLADNMLAVFEYPDAIATIRSSGLEVEGFSRRHFTVCGTEGTFHIQPLDRPAVRLSLSRERTFDSNGQKYPKGTSEIPFEPAYRRYQGDAADLAATIRGEKPNDFPSSHDLAVQQSVLAAAKM